MRRKKPPNVLQIFQLDPRKKKRAWGYFMDGRHAPVEVIRLLLGLVESKLSYPFSCIYLISKSCKEYGKRNVRLLSRKGFGLALLAPQSFSNDSQAATSSGRTFRRLSSKATKASWCST